MAFAHARQFQSVQALLQQSVASDQLTGLLNRRSWTDAAENLLARARCGERQAAVGLLIVGVDHLKQVNDRHGHGTGDQVLGTVAAALQHGLRERDLLARWAGDQFIALLAGSDAKTVRMVGERLRALVQAATVRVAGSGEVLALTASIGITVVDVNEPLDAAIARADKALDEAKQTGRNRVFVSRG
jgi:diguanylate cyclase (GGDEF)-like protein